MGRRTKLLRYEDNAVCSLLLEPGKAFYEQAAGRWNSVFFGREAPIVVELGCGHGCYSLGLACRYPDRHFVGIDLKGSRLWTASQMAVREGLSNVAFLRARIEHLGDFFASSELSAGYIFFPDPYPKDRHAKRRLLGRHWLRMYASVLKAGAPLVFKTDDAPLFAYAKEEVAAVGGLMVASSETYAMAEVMAEAYGIESRYEKRARLAGRETHALRFRLPSPAVR